MRVFDYSNGKKGEPLADIKICSGVHGHVVVKNGKRYKVELSRPADRQIGEREYTSWKWHTGADHIIGGKIVDITPEKFGVEAICFCIGEWHCGVAESVSEWQWCVIGTAEWNRNACKSGLLKAECLGDAC